MCSATQDCTIELWAGNDTELHNTLALNETYLLLAGIESH